MTRDDEIKQARIEYLQSEVRQLAARVQRTVDKAELRLLDLEEQIEKLQAGLPDAVR